jgi:hypothetical protein
MLGRLPAGKLKLKPSRNISPLYEPKGSHRWWAC